MQSLFCTRRRRFVSKKQRDYSVHISIDFGTDGLGIGYTIKNNVYIQKWPTNTYGQSKPKCIALFDDNEELISFGNSAKNDYLSLSAKQRNSWMLFEDIKIGLLQEYIHTASAEPDSSPINIDKKLDFNEILIATNGLTMASNKIIININEWIYNNCIEWLNNNNMNINNNEIEYIISIPSIWTDKAQKLWKKWCILGGFVNIRMVYESDCGSLGILYLLHKNRKHLFYDVESRFDAHRQRKFGFNFDDERNGKINKNEQFMVVDIGKGITNISYHSLYNKFTVCEVQNSLSILNGSNIINNRFNDLLNRIFSKLWMKQFKEKYPIKYIELMNNFNIAKCEYNFNYKWYNIRLPIEFIIFLEEKCKNNFDLNNIIQNNWLSQKDIKKVVLEDEYLKLNIKTWQKLFDKAIDTIINKIKYLLNKNNNKCKYLCMMGGFAKSNYLFKKIKLIFPQLKIIIPKKQTLTVVCGGACMAITKNFIRSRRLNRTYGVRVNLSLGCAYKSDIPSKHIYNNLSFNAERNICHIRNCFEIMAEKGEEIRINQVKIRKSRRLSGEQCSIIKYIYASDNKNQKIINENCEKLSEIKLDFDKTMNDVIIVTEFHFYDTMLKVFVYPESKPNLRKEVELSYQNC